MSGLQLIDVGRTYSTGVSISVLHGVTLEIEQGDFVTIEGPSGSGKSTLLNIIGTLDAPSVGTYKVGGVDTATARSKVLAELRSDTFAFVFQNFHLLDRRRAIDSVELSLTYRSVDSKVRRAKALAAMRELGIEDLAFTLSNRLSGGERQRVALARAIACDASVIIADEPTGNLDSVNAGIVVETLKRLHQDGRTIVLVTHSREVGSAGSRRVLLRGGALSERESDLDNSSKPPIRKTMAIGRPSRLRVRDLFVDAAANILSRRGRTLGLIAAVALGVALLIGTVGISTSARFQVSDRFDEHSSRDVTLQWQPNQLDEQPEHMRRTIPGRLSHVRGVAHAAVIGESGETDLQTGTGRPSLTASGFSGTRDTVAAARMVVDWAPGHGRVVHKGELLIGATLAKQSGLATLKLHPVVFVNQQPFTVVGLVSESPRIPELLGGILLSNSDASFLAPPQKDSALILTMSGAAKQVAHQAPLVVDPFAPKAIVVDTPTDPRTLRTQVESDVSATLVGLTALALLASMAGLANAMVLAVIERRQEFGLRRAIGARRHHIFGLVIAESVSIGLFGGVVGLLLGLVGILVVTITQRWVPVFDVALAPAAILGGMAVGAIGGVLAAIRAARILPGEALRL